MLYRRKITVGVLCLQIACAPLVVNATDAYDYDARANISSHTVDGQTSNYQYDQLDRIKSETGQASQSFGYDPNGNRTSDGSGTYTLVPNSNRLATRNGQAVSYDPAGNLLSETAKFNGQMVTRSYTYDLPGRLQTVSINGVQKASYLYDYKGQRVRKTLSNPPANTPAITIYEYNPNGYLVEEISGSAGPTFGKTLVTYAWKDDIPAAVIFAPNTPSNPSTTQERIVYLEVDQLNTPRKGTDQSGKVVWTWNSDAFGSTLANEDPGNTGQKTTINLRFPGQYFDAESGLHYNMNRYYDPTIGRYTQPDPLGESGGPNPYAYVQSQPTRYTDPSGLILPALALGGELAIDWAATTGAASMAGDLIWSLTHPDSNKDDASLKRCPPNTPCQPCKTVSGKTVPTGAIGYRPMDTPSKPQHGIAGPHYNIYKANQNPKNCQCFWQSIGAVPPSGLPNDAIPIEPFIN